MHKVLKNKGRTPFCCRYDFPLPRGMDYQDNLVKSVAFDDDYSVMEFRKKAMITKNHASVSLTDHMVSNNRI